LRLHPEDVADHAPAVLESIDPARHEVNHAFTRLSPGDQQLLVLCLIERIPPTAVAQLLRLRPGTVRTRLSRAKTRLRGLLNDSAPTLEEPAL
jgi:RNA polymerase sigma-70 factor (ECF subfamily)